jgi:hypothetical protein
MSLRTVRDEIEFASDELYHSGSADICTPKKDLYCAAWHIPLDAVIKEALKQRIQHDTDEDL